MPLDPRRVKELFSAALDLPDLLARSVFLDRECGGDAELRQQLEVLLAANDAPHAALNGPLVAEPPGVTADYAPLETVGSIIAGKYKLLQEIGEGGMGSVFMADQLQPVKRRVAVKVIKAGMDSARVLARFEAERQALALMDHPNIAKVLDAGTTGEFRIQNSEYRREKPEGRDPLDSDSWILNSSSRPFFVMELVKGVPLTQFCDEHKLPVLDRLNLFMQICSAVQHAHQKGIIHRDLKPSNILVESHDGKPVPKVIDFGLAKATSGMQLTEKSLFTAIGTVAGTPLYMAPEQAAFNAIDVDTRADVYALGVILYEMLTGTTPIERATFKQAAFDEILRVIREQEPPTPSSRISSSESTPSAAALRQMEPARLSRFVRGELDWIVMKSLSKERDRRYESATAFARDVERFLNHEPVQAGPPSAAYKLRKFARRNRPQVIAAGLVLLALVAGMAGTTFGLIRADAQRSIAGQKQGEAEASAKSEAEQRAIAQQKERDAKAAERLAIRREQESQKARDETRQVLDYLVAAFRKPDPEADGAKLTVAELLDQATQELETSFSSQPAIQAQLLSSIGSTYMGLGLYEKAITVCERARDLNRNELGDEHEHTLASMNNLGTAYLRARKATEALSVFEQLVESAKAKFGPEHSNTLMAMANLAMTYEALGRLADALPLLEQILELRTATLGPDHPHTLQSMNNLAFGYNSVKRFASAVPLLEQSLELMKAKLGPEHPDTLVLMNNLADAYDSVGRVQDALTLYETVLELRKTRLGPEHPDTLESMNGLAFVYASVGRLTYAVPLMEQTLQLRRLKLGPEHPHTLNTMGNLASTYLEAEEPEKARTLFDEFFAAGRRGAKPDDAGFAGLLAKVSLELLQHRQYAAAETYLRECLTIREKKLADDWVLFNTKSMLGEALAGQKKFQEAEPLLVEGYQGMKDREAKIPPAAKSRLSEALRRLVEFYTAWERPEEAKKWRTILEESTAMPD